MGSAGPGDINETPSVVVLMEKLDAGKQADIEAALTAIAAPMFEEAKAKKEDAPFCFLTGKSAGDITSRIRELVKAGDAGDKAQMYLLDIPDNGGYYVSPADDINGSTIGTFLEAYKSKALERQQL